MKDNTTFKHIVSFMMQFKGRLILALFFSLGAVFFSVLAPELIGKILDMMLEKKPFMLVFEMLIILSLFYLGYSFFQWFLMLLCNQIAFSSSCILRRMLYDKMNHLSVSFFDTHAHGDIISRFVNDVDLVSDGLIQSLSALLSGIAMIIATSIMMLRTNVSMSIVVMVCAPFTYFVARFITLRNHRYFKQQAKEVGSLNAYSEEMIAGIHTVKSFHQEKLINDEFKKLNQRLYDSGVKAQFFGSLVNPSTRLVTNLGYAIVGFAAVLLGMKGKISIGDISSFLMYSTLFAKPFNEITSVLTQMQSALASSERIFKILDQKEEQENDEESLPEVKGHLRFVNVSFSYQKDHPLIQNLNLDVPAGSNVAIVGKTGAGKTTLVNLLMRFYEISEGVIYLDGVNCAHLHRDKLRQCFGMVLQETYLFEDTVFANIAYGKENASKEEVIAAAKKSGAHQFIRRLEQGYDTLLDAKHSLSQGQMQLLSITRVMLLNPSVLILDEATSNIDTRTEKEITRAMQRLMEDKTSFVIAHRLSTITNADIILVMDNGNIVEKGTHEELLAKKGLYYELYNAQFE